MNGGRIYAFEDGHACGYYRVRLPLRALSLWGGWETKTHCGWDEECYDYPIVAGQRVGKYGMVGHWRRLRAGRRLVWECDDDLWSIDPTNIVAHLSHSRDVQDAVEECVRAANLVTVSTEPLAEVLCRHHDNVWVLPNHIDPDVLHIERKRSGRPVTVGWSGGDSHFADWHENARPIAAWQQANPNVDFHWVGTDFRRPVGMTGRYTGWQPDIWAYYQSIDFDVGLAPLADTTFNAAKSAIRLIEYGALGIPVVASDVGPYREYVEHGKTGFLVRRKSDWSRYLDLLVHDEAARVEMGRAAKAKAATMTIADGWKLWDAAYRTLI